MQLEQIIDLKCVKHIKIYKLSQAGYKNSDIAKHLSTNAGHVYNVLKDYREKPEKVEAANAITA